MKNKINKRDVAWLLIIITPVVWYNLYHLFIGLTEDYLKYEAPTSVTNCSVMPLKAPKQPAVASSTPSIINTTIREVSAYNSLPGQTDSTPCEGAYGNVCEPYKKGQCVVASNAFKKNTKIRIDKIGDCIVLDTMNKRYPNRVDIFMGDDVNRAISFGVQKLKVSIIK